MPAAGVSDAPARRAKRRETQTRHGLRCLQRAAQPGVPEGERNQETCAIRIQPRSPTHACVRTQGAPRQPCARSSVPAAPLPAPHLTARRRGAVCWAAPPRSPRSRGPSRRGLSSRRTWCCCWRRRPAEGRGLCSASRGAPGAAAPLRPRAVRCGAGRSPHARRSPPPAARTKPPPRSFAPSSRSHPPRPALSAAPRPVPPPAAAPPSPRAASQGEEPAQADTERRAERGRGASSPALSALPPQPLRGTGSRSKGKCLLGTSNLKKKKKLRQEIRLNAIGKCYCSGATLQTAFPLSAQQGQPRALRADPSCPALKRTAEQQTPPSRGSARHSAAVLRKHLLSALQMQAVLRFLPAAAAFLSLRRTAAAGPDRGQEGQSELFPMTDKQT